jgi:DNA mismatch endonuclease (patch repair protein)
MQANRGRDTSPELAVRSLLHARGLRYRVNAPLAFDRRRRADIVFSRARLAIFIDGCYWHGCPQHFQLPKTNTAFWQGKIEGNRVRDRETDAALLQGGWTVLRFWEHESPNLVVEAISGTLDALPPSVARAWRAL